jgi:rhodanese-related sulfurtransferase
MSLATTSSRSIGIEEAGTKVDAGAAFIDLRPTREYLDVHVPGSLSLTYEFGPGMAGRARDCIPLSVPFVLLHHEGIDIHAVTAALRGKGFTVAGYVEDGLTAWGNAHGAPASTEVASGPQPPADTVIDVGDPGVRVHEGALSITVERLWGRTDEVPEGRVAILAGRGVRAALAIGMLERAGFEDIVFWTHTR